MVFTCVFDVASNDARLLAAVSMGLRLSESRAAADIASSRHHRHWSPAVAKSSALAGCPSGFKQHANFTCIGATNQSINQSVRH